MFQKWQHPRQLLWAGWQQLHYELLSEQSIILFSSRIFCRVQLSDWFGCGSKYFSFLLFFYVFFLLFKVTPRFSTILDNVHVKTNLLAYAVKVEMVLSKVISAWHVFFLEVALQHCQKIGLWGFQVVCHYFKVLLLALPSFFVCDKILVSVSSKSTISIDEVCPDVFQLSPKFIGFFFCQKLYISKNIEKKIFLSIKRHLSQCRDYLQWLSNERRSY